MVLIVVMVFLYLLIWARLGGNGSRRILSVELSSCVVVIHIRGPDILPPQSERTI